MSPRSCGYRLTIVVSRIRFDDAVAFGVEGHGADRRPVAGIAGPARRIELASLGVERMPGRQDAVIVAGVALVRADMADAAVAMIDVVPTDETSRPSTSLVEIGEPPGGKLGTVLGGTKR